MAALELDDLDAVVEWSPAAISREIAPIVASEVVLAPERSIQERKADRLRAIEDQLLQDSIAIVSDTMRFPQIDPNDATVNPEWIKELGYEKATERDRVARYGLMSAKEAPVGIKVAQAISSSIIKARSVEKAGPRSLNIAVVQMTAPPPIFRELELEDR